MIRPQSPEGTDAKALDRVLVRMDPTHNLPLEERARHVDGDGISDPAGAGHAPRVVNERNA